MPIQPRIVLPPIPRYRKKPVVIEAVRHVPDGSFPMGKWITDNGGQTSPGSGGIFFIKTLEGLMTVRVGDYVVRGIAGEFYPCRADIFEKTYDRIIESIEDEANAI